MSCETPSSQMIFNKAVLLTQESEHKMQLLLDSGSREHGPTSSHLKQDTANTPVQRTIGEMSVFLCN